MRSSARALLVAFLVVLVTLAAGAAGLPVSGKVVDPAGAAVPGATVELLAGPNSVAKIVSAADGTFRFADVPAGNYRVRVTLAGFRATEMSFVVGTTTPAPLTVKLLIGSISETVKVTAESPMVTRVQGAPSLPAAAPCTCPQTTRARPRARKQPRTAMVSPVARSRAVHSRSTTAT